MITNDSHSPYDGRMANRIRSTKGVARQEQILQTAMEVLAQDGYRNTSMRSIGRALEIEPAHILYYFDSREHLLQKVVERWDEDALAKVGGNLDPSEGLDHFVAMIRSNLEVPGLVHVYLSTAAEATDSEHSAHEYFRDRFVRVHELLESSIRFEQSVGKMGKQLDASLEARKLVALADGLQLQALVDSRVDAPSDLEAAVAALRETSRGDV